MSEISRQSFSAVPSYHRPPLWRRSRSHADPAIPVHTYGLVRGQSRVSIAHDSKAVLVRSRVRVISHAGTSDRDVGPRCMVVHKIKVVILSLQISVTPNKRKSSFIAIPPCNETIPLRDFAMKQLPHWFIYDHSSRTKHLCPTIDSICSFDEIICSCLITFWMIAS